ncbi:uncharacterized protein LOC122027134 [Zingiber officinale]|uniref:uncharacterized protein LOC122027134 n=1 Tax=Zingiber officinale TaxID=94328 RepID=UPI001C4B3EE8|nr:uncharacterized protein LOC122027134 [Zingiber officinale]
MALTLLRQKHELTKPLPLPLFSLCFSFPFHRFVFIGPATPREWRSQEGVRGRHPEHDEESAVRILAAERRTLQWKQSSSLVKEDSVSLILRLKALMDSRIKETESVNLSQATRIQELEVQLREANHTIRRLNSKLQNVSSELETQKSDKSESLQGKDTDDRISLQKNNPDEAASSQETVPHSTYAKYSNQKEPTKDSTASDDSTGIPDLVSLILRNKEPEPFRNEMCWSEMC